MSYETLYPGAANLIGNVAIARNTNPTIRASLRRNNPDFSSSVPYYPSAAGKTLRINYTKEVSTVVTPVSIDIVLSATSLASIVTDINAADTPNLRALDLDGFLAIQNLNPGKTHKLTVSPFTTPASDAAPILGFTVDPFPGSTSFAGEIAPAPGSRSQLNSQTVMLLAQDDALGSKEINRPLISILQMLEDLRSELSRDVIIYKDVLLSFSSHNPGPIPSARINNDAIRLFYPFPGANPPTSLNPQDIDPYFRALDSSGSGEDVVNFGVGVTDASALRVTNLYYATNLTDFNSAAVFATWGTPDGGTIISSTTANKTKHPSTSITSIQGNIVFCTGATFVTHKIKAGDPVKLTAAVLQPFDHSGWYAVDAVIDETHLAVRPMASSEEIPDGTTVRPRWLNPLAGGTLLIAVGRFVPAGDIYVTINSQTLTGSHIIRLPVGAKFIDTITQDRARDLSGTLSRLGAVLQDHLQDLPDRHPVDAITGFTSTTSWRDSTTISGTNLKQTIEDILTDLKAQATSNSGTGRIGAEVISIGGATPNTLAQGTVLSQLTALLTALQAHVIQASGAHAATAVSYAGGPNWADGTTNPSTTVESQLDKVITDLAVSTGTAKLGGAASGSDIAAGTLAAQIVDLATNWLKMSRNNTIAGIQTFNALLSALGGLIVAGDSGSGPALLVGGQLLSFSNFTYTADNTTDKLAKTAHGLQTGDGPVRVTNSGGALPSGIVAGTDYYTIFSDVDHFQFAATRADALSGFAIDLLDNGTGTQTLAHQSGTTRVSDATVTRSATIGSLLTAANEQIGGISATVISAVLTANTVSDTLDLGPAHGLQTGTGPVRVTNSGGALPAPLLVATDYWVIRNNTTKIQLATSFANAMTGVAIDLTTTGSGTNTLVAGTLPTAAGNCVVHGNVQVDGSLTVKSDTTLYFSAAAFQEGLPNSIAFSSFSNSFGSAWDFTVSTPNDGIALSLGFVPSGKTIKTIVIYFSKNADGSTLTVKLRKHPVGAQTGGVDLVTATDTTSGVITRLSLTLSPNYVVESEFFVDLVIQWVPLISDGNFFGAKIVFG